MELPSLFDSSISLRISLPQYNRAFAAKLYPFFRQGHRHRQHHLLPLKLRLLLLNLLLLPAALHARVQTFSHSSRVSNSPALPILFILSLAPRTFSSTAGSGLFRALCHGRRKSLKIAPLDGLEPSPLLLAHLTLRSAEIVAKLLQPRKQLTYGPLRKLLPGFRAQLELNALVAELGVAVEYLVPILLTAALLSAQTMRGSQQQDQQQAGQYGKTTQHLLQI